MAPNRPQCWWQVAFNAEPNDPLGVRRWTDLTAMVAKVSQAGRGRQYELAKSQAGQPPITFRDVNEYLNQANTSSPYYPNVQPLREILGQAMAPNGGTGNLVNPNMWMPNDITPLDPSFESYANGAAAPGALTALGGVTPTVTTTNPQQGTKSLTYTVAAAATRQGIALAVPCVPGEQYTTSAYVRQSTASTQQLLVGDQTVGYDAFLTSSTSGWAAPPVGGTWGNTGGAAADYSITGAIDGGVAFHNTATTGVGRQTVLTGATATDHHAVMRIRCPAVTTGGIARAGHLIRRVDGSNFYEVSIDFNTDQTLTLRLARTVAGVSTTITSGTLTFRYAALDWIWLEAEVVGTTLRGRAWRDGTLMPTAWSLSATDSNITAPGATACITFRAAGNTNGALAMGFSRYSAVGAVSSTTTTTTGSYVRLTNTFTATQPSHTVTVGTVGTAVAGTVNVDAVQHEPGASANAFTTSGPNIFPLLRDNVERWPRSNQEGTAGFAGECNTTAVDGFAALNAITLDLDYPAAVMALQPNYFWRLDAGSGASFGLETSGNNGPALVPVDSKYGPGVEPEFGLPMDIPGATGASGVKFTPTGLVSSSQPDTILACGRTPTVPGIRWPASFGTASWGLSMACWVRVAQTDPVTNQLILLPATGPGLSNPTFFYLLMTASGNALAFSHSPINGADLSAGDVTAIDDSQPHLLVATMTQASGGNTVLKLYVDGTLSASGTATTASLGGMFTAPATALGVGGGWTGGFILNGATNYVGLWERELSPTEVAGLWTAGGLGYAGELSGARLARRLAQGGFVGQTRISAGSTTMQPSTAGVTDALSDAQDVTDAEGGTLWVAPDGTLIMEGRQQRWVRLTSRGTFGEDAAAGEIPYADGVVFDFDPSFVAANVKVSRVNGTTAIGGTAAEIAAVGRKYFPRSSPPDNNDYETDTLAQYKADWVFNTHKAPLLRVSMLTVDLGSNPSLATKVLSIEVGQRWTVKRRAKAANNGAGIVQSEDYFIERVIHDEINFDTDAWRVSFLMSPIGLITNSPYATFQPWILENPTYGVLDSTTVLGW